MFLFWFWFCFVSSSSSFFALFKAAAVSLRDAFARAKKRPLGFDLSVLLYQVHLLATLYIKKRHFLWALRTGETVSSRPNSRLTNDSAHRLSNAKSGIDAFNNGRRQMGGGRS